MKIIHMREGEVVKELDFKSRTAPLIPEDETSGRKIDWTASKFIRRLKRLIEKECYFVQSGLNEDRRGPHYWYIFHTGDNCLKVYPEGGCYTIP